MSKIIKLPNAKPITCACCGGIYEFESGDALNVTYCLTEGTNVFLKSLDCPICHFSNEIEFEKENKNAKNKG